MMSSASRSFWILATVVWLIMVAAYIHAGFQPDHWPRRGRDASTLPYPLAHVTVFCVITAVEIAIAGMIARPGKARRLSRLSALLLVMLLWSLPWAMTTMHQSPVRDCHMNWLLLLNAAVLLAVCTDATLQSAGFAYRWISARRPPR